MCIYIYLILIHISYINTSYFNISYFISPKTYNCGIIYNNYKIGICFCIYPKNIEKMIKTEKRGNFKIMKQINYECQVLLFTLYTIYYIKYLEKIIILI